MAKNSLVKPASKPETGLVVRGGNIVAGTLTKTESALLNLPREQQASVLSMQHEVTAVVSRVELLRRELATVNRKINESDLMKRKRQLVADIKTLTDYARETSWQFNGIIKINSEEE